MRLLRLIPGPPLLGFAEAFEASRGDPATPTPYPIVTPARVGPVLLPFRCPHCGQPVPELACGSSRRSWCDPARGFYWCPRCRKRLKIDDKGHPLDRPLPAGAEWAPALISRGGQAMLEKAAPDRTGALEMIGAAET